MNSLRRPRRRPRQSSVNFRVLGWLLVREGALRVCMAPAVGTSVTVWRRFLAERRPASIVRLVGSVLRRYPERRIF